MIEQRTFVHADAGSDRLTSLGSALVELGFIVSIEEGHLRAASDRAGAQATRQHLRARGFGDREARITLDYVRRWGFL